MERYKIERNYFMEFLEGIMSAQPGTLAYEVKDAWAKFAVCINSDKL